MIISEGKGFLFGILSICQPLVITTIGVASHLNSQEVVSQIVRSYGIKSNIFGAKFSIFFSFYSD